jgi:hypothetical protein
MTHHFPERDRKTKDTQKAHGSPTGHSSGRRIDKNSITVAGLTSLVPSGVEVSALTLTGLYRLLHSSVQIPAIDDGLHGCTRRV